MFRYLKKAAYCLRCRTVTLRANLQPLVRQWELVPLGGGAVGERFLTTRGTSRPRLHEVPVRRKIEFSYGSSSCTIFLLDHIAQCDAVIRHLRSIDFAARLESRSGFPAPK